MKLISCNNVATNRYQLEIAVDATEFNAAIDKAYQKAKSGIALPGFRKGKAICGSRGWLYNSEKDEDIKIVNREVGRLNASLDDAAKRFPDAEPIVFLHYPPVYGHMACDGILQVLKERNIKRCYFGHIHGSQASKRAIKGEWEGIKMHLISCDYVGFTPVLIRE